MRILRDPAPTEGGGKETPAPAPDYSALLAKHSGDANALAMALVSENAGLRSATDRLKAEYADIKKQVPASGSRVLSADEAKELDAYLGLGKPADLAKALDSGKEATGKVAAFEREKLLADAAKPYGYSPSVLAKLAGADLAIEVVDGKGKDGKPAKVAEVVAIEKGKDGKDVEKRTSLDEYAKQHWAEFLPSLEPKAEPPARTTPSFARTEELANHQPNGQPELIRSVF